MADEQEVPESDEATEEAPKKGGRLKSIIMIVVGLGLGTGAGMFFVGPRFFGGPAEASAESTEDGSGHGEGEAPADDGHGAPADDGGGEPAADATIHTVANLIVNPAGSNGNRFLLVDLAVELSNEEAVTELEARDAEVRDLLLLLLGAKTVQELADVSQRAPLKIEMQKLISELLDSGSARDIFFPRFVIQ